MKNFWLNRTVSCHVNTDKGPAILTRYHGRWIVTCMDADSLFFELLATLVMEGALTPQEARDNIKFFGVHSWKLN